MKAENIGNGMLEQELNEEELDLAAGGNNRPRTSKKGKPELL